MRLLLAAVALAFPALAYAADDVIIPKGAKLELLWTRTAKLNGGLTEGPCVAPDGSIYFSDIPFSRPAKKGSGGADDVHSAPDKGMILRFDPKTKKTTVFTDDSHKSNGLKFDAKGNLIACEGSDEGGRAVASWDIKTKKRTVLADSYKGKRFNAPNDLAIDTKGRIYFSDPRYLGTEKRELKHRAVYRLDPETKEVVEIAHDAEKPNGVSLSPDGKTLYVADHNNGTDRIDPDAPAPKPGAMKIYAYPLGEDGLVHGKRKTLVDFGAGPGCDGMCVDVKGNVYLAVRDLKRPGIMVIDPDGKEVAFLPTGKSQVGAKNPTGIPSNVAFGRGAEAKTLYVTVDVSLYRIPLGIAGYRPGE